MAWAKASHSSTDAGDQRRLGCCSCTISGLSSDGDSECARGWTAPRARGTHACGCVAQAGAGSPRPHLFLEPLNLAGSRWGPVSVERKRGNRTQWEDCRDHSRAFLATSGAPVLAQPLRGKGPASWPLTCSPHHLEETGWWSFLAGWASWWRQLGASEPHLGGRVVACLWAPPLSPSPHGCARPPRG